MERHMKQFDKEYMKTAMLKQEETFRHQVHELHRLYRVQKKLMIDVKEAELKRQRLAQIQIEGNDADLNHQCYSYAEAKPPCRKLDLELPAEKHTGKNNGHAKPEPEEESDLELTLATGGSRIRRKAKDASFTSESVSSFSSSSSESETTKVNIREWGSFQASEASMMRLRNEPRTGFDIEGRLRQDGLKQPPWLMQYLSLNMTS